jgi:hypothetical protein
MSSYYALLGRDIRSRKKVLFDLEKLNGHLNLIGATGSGKTTLIFSLLWQMFVRARPKTCVVLVDPMGGLSETILTWMAHPKLCPEFVRERLVYVEPAAHGQELIVSINPLNHYNNQDELYFSTGQTVEVVQRAWESQQTESMPLFRLWMFNALFSVATMGLPPAAAEFLIRPGSDQHSELIKQMPSNLQGLWTEIMKAGPSARAQILSSTRTRSAPFFDHPQLKLMMSQTHNRFDIQQFIRERKIVIVNLNQKSNLDPGIASTLGGIVVNQVIQAARNMPPEVVNPTVLCLDEFQRFVGIDLYNALPEMRQRGLKLILSHQSLSQLKRGDVDMTDIIWQCRNRIILANDARDADDLAHELATVTYDPKKLKEELKTFRQRKVGQQKVWLKNYSNTSTNSTASDVSSGSSSGDNRSESKPKDGDGSGSVTRGRNENQSSSRSDKVAQSDGRSEGGSETLVDILEDFYEVSSRSYYTFDEQMRLWAQRIRRSPTGVAVAKFKDDPNIYEFKGLLSDVVLTDFLEEMKLKLLEANYKQDIFIPRQRAQAEWDMIVENLRMGRTPKTIEAELARENRPSGDDNHSAFR